MRSSLYILALIAVGAMAFWAYRVNYETQDALDRVAALHKDIAKEREALAVLRAEWAHLNNPDRLRQLVAENQSVLGLGPLAPTHFERVGMIAFPHEPEPENDAPEAADDPEALQIADARARAHSQWLLQGAPHPRPKPALR